MLCWCKLLLLMSLYSSECCADVSSCCWWVCVFKMLWWCKLLLLMSLYSSECSADVSSCCWFVSGSGWQAHSSGWQLSALAVEEFSLHDYYVAILVGVVSVSSLQHAVNFRVLSRCFATVCCCCNILRMPPAVWCWPRCLFSWNMF